MPDPARPTALLRLAPATPTSPCRTIVVGRRSLFFDDLGLFGLLGLLFGLFGLIFVYRGCVLSCRLVGCKLVGRRLVAVFDFR